MDLRPGSTEDTAKLRAELLALRVTFDQASALLAKAEIALAIYDANQDNERRREALQRAYTHIDQLAEMSL